MRIRSNDQMKAYLEALGYDFLSTTIPLHPRLEMIVNSEFLVENDCILLKGLNQNHNIPKFETDLEKCEWEYNETHFHPDMFWDGTEEIEILKLTLECGKRIAKRLQETYPYKVFRIQLDFAETEYLDSEIERYGAGTVRFYKVRPTSEYTLYHADLNVFKRDAVMEIEV